MRILCTNDDGHEALGLRVLADAGRTLGEVWTVAPDREQSASSHALSLERPLSVTSTGLRGYHVDGTPTDCVLLAVEALLEPPPDVVLSGVNHGSNMGEDVLYSGTVAAAMEATLLGIPAVAVSYAGHDPDAIAAYGPWLAHLLRALVRRDDFPRDALFNVNLPAGGPEGIRGVRFTRLGRRVYTESVATHRDGSGRTVYRIGGGRTHWSGHDDSDYRAVEAGFVSVTPLHLDLTHVELLTTVSGWTLDRRS